MRQAILDACQADGSAGARVPDLTTLHFALGERFAEAARLVTETGGVPLAEVEAIASHGQTVWHQPTPYTIGGMSATGTLQLGEPAVIAARTGCRVVANFRAADMAAGGQGAPLVPYADWALLTSETENRAALNIGGIANVTLLPRNAVLEDVIAFDTGPGNILIDDLVRRFTDGEKLFDTEGAWAAQEDYSGLLGEWLLSDPFFAAPPPKTTGRELFSREFVDRFLSIAQKHLHGTKTQFQACMLATVTMATAVSIRLAFQQWLLPRLPDGRIETVIVGGGGSRNHTLMRMLSELLAPSRIATAAEFGLPDDAKEAIAFALLGYETLHGRPSNVPAASGATRPAILGSITPAPLR